MPEKQCKWTFSEQAENSYGYGYRDAMGENFKKLPYVSLVRESIQNSLDAVLDESQPVKVEFSFSNVWKRDYPRFLYLKSHILACKEKDRDNEDIFEAMLNSLDSGDEISFLVVSDYNTKGMSFVRRDWKSPFNAFVRSGANSSKNNRGAGGSFGFGKGAYFNLSPIKTMLVSTKTKDNETFFEGVSMLSDHTIGGTDYAHVGYYDNEDGKIPCSGDKIPNRFVREQIGTDVYIVIDKLDVAEQQRINDEMIRAVLRNFWFSVLENKLVVKIGDTIVDFTSLKKLMARNFYEMDDNVSAYSDYFSEKYSPYYYYSVVSTFMNNEDTRIIKNEDGAVEFVLEEADLETLGSVKLYIRRVKNAKDKVLCMRKPRMLICPKGQDTQYGFYGVFVCISDQGNRILSKMENAAHNQWSYKNCPNANDVPTARAAIRERNDFIKKVVEKYFKVQGDKGIDIPDLDKRLVNSGLLDKKSNPNPFSTNISRKNKGAILNNKLGTPPRTLATVSTKGEVVFVVDGGVEDSNDKKNIIGGNGNGNKKSNGGNKPGTGTKPVKGMKPSQNQKGRHTEAIPVDFRVITKDIEGQIYHRILIKSNANYPSCDVIVKIGGADSDNDIAIVEVMNPGVKIEGEKKNILKGINLSVGKNEIIVRFYDNAVHGLKLKAYETE